MAYDTKELYQKALSLIKEKHLFFIEDVVAYLGIAKPTFYEHFPIDSNEMNDIKEAIEKEKVNVKVSIRSKLHKGNQTAGLLALYKLICTDEERKALAMEYKEHSGEIKLPQLQVEVVKPDESK